MNGPRSFGGGAGDEGRHEAVDFLADHGQV